MTRLFGMGIAAKFMHVASENEKLCECKKLINVNSIKSELFGAIYPDEDGFAKCSYDYRETG